MNYKLNVSNKRPTSGQHEEVFIASLHQRGDCSVSYGLVIVVHDDDFSLLIFLPRVKKTRTNCLQVLTETAMVRANARHNVNPVCTMQTSPPAITIAITIIISFDCPNLTAPFHPSHFVSY